MGDSSDELSISWLVDHFSKMTYHTTLENPIIATVSLGIFHCVTVQLFYTSNNYKPPDI